MLRECIAASLMGRYPASSILSACLTSSLNQDILRRQVWLVDSRQASAAVSWAQHQHAATSLHSRWGAKGYSRESPSHQAVLQDARQQYQLLGAGGNVSPGQRFARAIVLLLQQLRLHYGLHVLPACKTGSGLFPYELYGACNLLKAFLWHRDRLHEVLLMHVVSNI